MNRTLGQRVTLPRVVLTSIAFSLAIPGLLVGQNDRPMAIVGVDVLPMTDQSTVLRGQTVLVVGGRFAAVGPHESVSLPAGTTVIDGRGQFLVPGLIDAHVHVSARFRDAPLFLAHGVTAVIQAAGAPQFLETRARTQAPYSGLPRLYTASPPVNAWEDDVATTEVAGYARAGYDAVKVFGFQPDHVAEKVYQEAERHGIAVIGHAQNNRGVMWSVNRGLQLVHASEFLETYFNPGPRHLKLFWFVGGAGVLVLASIGAVGLRAGWRQGAIDAALPHVVSLSCLSAALCVTLLALTPPWGIRFGDETLLWIATALTVTLGIVGGSCIRWPRVTGLPRLRTTHAGIAAIAVAVVGGSLLPRLWQARERSILRLAHEVAATGLPITPTLIQFEYGTNVWTGNLSEVITRAALYGVREDLVERWVHENYPPTVFPGLRGRFRQRQRAKLHELVSALHEAGVPLGVGTDVTIPGIIPGRSVHEELALLQEAGLSFSRERPDPPPSLAFLS